MPEPRHRLSLELPLIFVVDLAADLAERPPGGVDVRVRGPGTDAPGRAIVRYLISSRAISLLAKTSLDIDHQKVDQAKEILGTRTLAATVDGALDEVISLAARRRIMERIRKSKTTGIGPTPEELRRLREP